MEQRHCEEVAAKEEAERNVGLLKTAKEMIAGENEVNLSLFGSEILHHLPFFISEAKKSTCPGGIKIGRSANTANPSM